jgi:hypothetical protein
VKEIIRVCRRRVFVAMLDAVDVTEFILVLKTSRTHGCSSGFATQKPRLLIFETT